MTPPLFFFLSLATEGETTPQLKRLVAFCSSQSLCRYGHPEQKACRLVLMHVARCTRFRRRGNGMSLVAR